MHAESVTHMIRTTNVYSQQ